jgi:integrase
MSPSNPKLGTIEERNGKFRARLPRALDPDRRSRTFETRELAEKFLRGASSVLQDASPHGHDTLASFGDEMLDARELAGIRSIRRERSAWRLHVMPSKLATMPLASITRRDVQAWVDELARKKPANSRHRRGAKVLSKESVRIALHMLRTAFAYAREREYLDDTAPDPLANVRLGRDDVTADAWTFLTAAEIELVIRCEKIPERFKELFIVAVYSGLRVGELWALAWANVELEGDRPQLVVRFSHDGPTKTGKVRRVPLLPPALEVLRRMRARLPERIDEDELVFTALRGGAYRRGEDAGWGDRKLSVTSARPARGSVIPGWKTLAGIKRPVRFYDATRHTFASHLVMGTWGTTWTLQEVAAMLGHSSVTMTQRYAHLSPEHLSGKAANTARGMVPVLVPKLVPPMVPSTESNTTMTAGKPAQTEPRDVSPASHSP